MADRKRNAASAATGRTIEDIERREAEVRILEREGLLELVAFMRDLAVRLPAESRLPLYLAHRARNIETDIQLYSASRSTALGASNELRQLVRELNGLWPDDSRYDDEEE